MVDVDDSVGILIDEIRTKNSHVAGQDHQIDVMGFQERQLSRFGGFVMASFNRNMMERNSKSSCDILQILMIRDDQGNSTVQGTVTLKQQEIMKAVILS